MKIAVSRLELAITYLWIEAAEGIKLLINFCGHVCEDMLVTTQQCCLCSIRSYYVWHIGVKANAV
jgi:hypothetical protein